MGRQTVEETIDGRAFQFTHLDPFNAIRLQSYIAKALGTNPEAIASLSTGSGEKLFAVLGSIPADDILAVVRLLGGVSKIKPPGGDAWLVMSDAVFDAHMAGDVLLMWKWLGANVKFQLADFFAKRPTA